MTPERCPRLFEAEAASDGRLTGAALARFERHLASCAACSREAEALGALDDAVRSVSRARPDDLRTRRERTRLLGAFERELVTPRPSSKTQRALALAVACVALGSLLLWQVLRSASEPAAGVSVQAKNSALWSQSTEGAVERIRLESGSLSIHVDHSLARDRRVVVSLPDGELEDIGTTFSVNVEHGRTTRVVVRNGSVVLRVKGEAPVAIGAGEAWSPSLLPVAPVSAALAKSAATPAPLLNGSAAPTLSTVPTASRPRSSEPLAATRAPDAAFDFRAATAALDAGDNQRAASAFASFLAKYPRDPRAEDAAYLRVIAFQHSGDVTRTKHAAREYLDRYRVGFRRPEVEALAR